MIATAMIVTLLATNWIAISAYILMLDKYRDTHDQLQVEIMNNRILKEHCK